LFGSDEFAERVKRQKELIAAVANEFLRRELFVAQAGGSAHSC